MDPSALWQRYRTYLCECPSVGLTLDVSRMNFPDDYFQRMQPGIDKAFAAMDQLEAGAIANPDENRMVGHYWLRAPERAPQEAITTEIQDTLRKIDEFAKKVHGGEVKPPTAAKFTDILVIGIGGSALGPQLVADSLATKNDAMAVHFLDNTDPDGIDRVVDKLGSWLKSTLCICISKSGGTPEPRNGMLEMEAVYQRKGLEFAKHTVCVTGAGSNLDKYAQEKGFLARFPMWDWVGGRTSVMSAVGLVPAALQGLDIHGFLKGAAEMDRVTRLHDTQKNPAALLALMWYHATGGRGQKDMVVLPYKDRLLLFSRYLQQLVMESLGKEKDLSGNTVNQGIAVYGNKGSTDQHAYVQQLRDGVNNFFATFIVVLQDRSARTAKTAPQVDPGVTSGDYLSGFWQGTRAALYEKGRESITITVQTVDAATLGVLIALYERAVGFYATLVNINAYHQPGVEAGKKAAGAVLALQARVVEALKAQEKPATVDELAERLSAQSQAETIYHVLEHLVANKRGVARSGDKYRAKA